MSAPPAVPPSPLPPSAPFAPAADIRMTLAEALARPIGPGRLRETVLALENRQPPAQDPPAIPPGITVARHAGGLVWPEFAPLFHAVGNPWLWRDRLVLPAQDQQGVMADPRVVRHILHRDGQPLGFCEMDRRRPAEGFTVMYFGLVPDAIGAGLGRVLFGHALADAWAAQPPRVHLTTCTHDSPRAPAFYRAHGFAVVDRWVVEADDPRHTGVLPSTAGAAFPLAPLETRPPALSTGFPADPPFLED